MRVTVFGSARLHETSPEYEDGVRLGRELAGAGHVVVTGGYGGLMEAVSRGAHEAGGTVIGITMTPWSSRLHANQYLSEERAAETLFARIEALVESDGLVVLSGGAGTLGELALAWNLRQMNLMSHKPIVLVGQSWRHLVNEFRKMLVVGDADVAMLTLVENVDGVLPVLEAMDAKEPQATWVG